MKLIKIPFSGGTLNVPKGAEEAPDKIVEAMKSIYLDELGRKVKFNVERVQVNSTNIEETNENIYKHLQDNDDFPVVVGGDHSITYSCFRAFSKQFENPGIIIFDAHPDTENNFSPPSHEDFLKVLIEEKTLKPENVILVGIRNWHEKELSYLKEKKIRYFKMKDIFEEELNEVCDSIMYVAKNFGSLYISVDIDVLDPAFAPGTGYKEAGGMSTRELLYFIQRLKKLKNYKMADLVEVNPKIDVTDLTVKAAAKIITELAPE
ncbi:arginase family protein [Candidatus Woesearchaeota archaeon]|nr:arginase family protein [Candidatus Woesearchaeota archaeon]